MNENSAEIQSVNSVTASREAITTLSSAALGVGVGLASSVLGATPEWSVGLATGTAMGTSVLRDFLDRRAPPQSEHPFFTGTRIAGKMLMSGFIAWGATHMINIPEAHQVIVQFGEGIKTLWQSATAGGAGEAATQVATQAAPATQDLEASRELIRQAGISNQQRREFMNTVVAPAIPIVTLISAYLAAGMMRRRTAVPKSQIR